MYFETETNLIRLQVKFYHDTLRCARALAREQVTRHN